MMQAYKADLAYIHDVGFGRFAEDAAAGLLDILRRARISRGRVVDLGCGSGIWAAELIDAGYDVLGVDLSADMIEIARRRAPRAKFQVGSYLNTRLPSCAAVTSIGECFSYLFDENNGKRPLASLFRRVYTALEPGGLFLFDVATPGRAAGPSRKYWEGDDWAVLVEFDEDGKRKRLTRRITSFRKVGKLYRRDREVHHVRLYDRTELATMLRGVGFRVRPLRGYGELRFPKGLAGFQARKP